MKRDEIPEAGGFVYILKSISGKLYVGSTENIVKRMWEHKEKVIEDSYPAKNLIDQLIYLESFPELYEARDREYQIKRWSRKKKLNLIGMKNSLMLDLASDWFKE